MKPARYGHRCDFPGCDSAFWVQAPDGELLRRMFDFLDWGRVGGAEFCSKHPNGADWVG